MKTFIIFIHAHLSENIERGGKKIKINLMFVARAHWEIAMATIS
jgi:hypothetical protein